MKKEIMDLMDWKNVEKNTEDMIRSAQVNVEINTMVLLMAKKKIKELGGKTSQEELEEVKKSKDKLE